MDDYPTNPEVLRHFTDEQWEALLSRLETARLSLPRPTVTIDRRRPTRAKAVADVRKRLTEDQHNAIVEQLCAGAVMADIAKRFGISRQRVHQMKKRILG